MSEQDLSEISAALAALESSQNRARRDRQRRLVVLSGQRRWARELLDRFFAERDLSRGLWLGASEPAPPLPVVQGDIHALLGRNLSWAVVDVWEGLNPDALAALAGAVSGGGLLILCVPPRHEWRGFADPDYGRLLVYPYTENQLRRRFHDHFVRTLEQESGALWIEQGAVPAAAETVLSQPGSVIEATTTEDQQRAIDAIVHVLKGHSRRPLIMTSDRGRGKSSALGLASARIMGRGDRQLVVTAPRRASVQPVFEHASRALGLVPVPAGTTRIEYGASSLSFLPPDELLRNPRDLDLLMVDEAAAIPAPILKALVQRYNRVVFSTTVHGYEGTGRGFDVRFRQELPALVNQVREVTLEQPVRWADNDPVEAWLYRALLLDARPADLPGEKDIAHRCVIEPVDRDLLTGQMDTLRELFGLLVLSHYQTKPSDLRNLLDGPNISLWLARYQGRVTGAVLVAGEGGFQEPLAGQITRGKRRPRGHLLAQTLAAHAGFEEAPALRYWRIMRIAVHPDVQRRGIGRQLIEAVVATARERNIDCLGSSFAATPDTLAFWRSVQCVPVRLGLKRDASSGCHSAIVLSALSPAGAQLLDRASARFAEQLPRLLEHPFSDLEPELVQQLLGGLPAFPGYQLGQQDWLDIAVFIAGGRQFEDCRLALWKLTILCARRSMLANLLQAKQRQLLIACVLQNIKPGVVCQRCDYRGKSDLLQQLRSAVASLYHRLLEK